MYYCWKERLYHQPVFILDWFLIIGQNRPSCATLFKPTCWIVNTFMKDVWPLFIFQCYLFFNLSFLCYLNAVFTYILYENPSMHRSNHERNPWDTLRTIYRSSWGELNDGIKKCFSKLNVKYQYFSQERNWRVDWCI